VQFRLVVSAPTVESARNLWLAAQFNEGSSGTGSNPDVAFASGSFTPAAPGCGGVANYFLSTQKVHLANGSAGPCTLQQAALDAPAFTAQGTFASLGLEPSSTLCYAGYNCFGGAVTATVNNGDPLDTGAVIWTIRWSSDLYTNKPKGVLHFHTLTDAPQVISFKTADQCKTDTQVGCWTNYVSTTTYTEVTFRTSSTSSVRGW
jgi:hypothetical protein